MTGAGTGALRGRRLLGWLGAACLLAIIPVKAVRFLPQGPEGTVLGVAPSLLGSAGLLFLLASGRGRLARFSLAQVTLVAVAIASAAELVQLLPRPGILARIRYTFDVPDLVASGIGIALARAAAGAILGRPRG